VPLESDLILKVDSELGNKISEASTTAINSSNAVKITVGPGGVPQKSIKGTSREATSLLSGNYPAHKAVDKKKPINS